MFIERTGDMLYIIQNDPEVPPGIIAEELERLGVEPAIIRPYEGDELPALSDVSAVVVLGGAMGANDDAKHLFLSDLKQFIRDVVAQGRPYLGVCLGGQLLAAALGSEVRSSTDSEKGTCSIMLTDEGLDDRLFRGIAPSFISFQWHNDSFVIPPEGVWLAFTETCRSQAFRIGKNAWGVQFHPEVNPEIVRNWSSWTPETAGRTDEFVTTYMEWETEYRGVARRLVTNFLDAAGLRRVE